MSTIPTQNPVPSEAASDLKYNAGKIDEFVTSMKNKYIDRFGQEHFTIEGLRWVAQQAISQFGYITLDSFQKGAEITLPNQVLRDEVTGEYYRWDGAFPKVVPIDSTPGSSGGIGVGSWLSIGDAALRQDLASNTGASLIKTEDGDTVQDKLSINNNSANYRDRNVKKLSFVDQSIRDRLAFKVLFQGDSITAGYDTSSTDVVPPENGDWAQHASMNYPKRFVEFIGQQSGCQVTRTVRAISGYTAKQALNNADWQSNPNCDIAILMYAINDSSNTTIDEYLDSMEKLIKRFIDWGMGVVVCMPAAGGQGSGNTKYQVWARRIKMISSVYGCAFFDANEVSYYRHNGSIQSDSLHFNSMGYAILGEQLASMFMAGGLLETYRPITNPITTWIGRYDNSIAFCDAKGNIDTSRSEWSYTRTRIVGRFPAKNTCVASFSFYLDSEAAHVFIKGFGGLYVIHDNSKWWNNRAQPHYDYALSQDVSYATDIEAGAYGFGSVGASNKLRGVKKFAGRIMGRGWHTITVFNDQSGNSTSDAYLNAITIQPVPIGYSIQEYNSERIEKRVKSVYSLKIPALVNGALPSSSLLKTFLIRCPQGLMPSNGTNYFLFANSGHAILRISNHLNNGEFYEFAIIKTSAETYKFNVLPLKSTQSNTPTVQCTLGYRSRNEIIKAKINGSQPIESIIDYSGGFMELTNADGIDTNGGLYLKFDINWGSDDKLGYWNIEVESSDIYGSDEIFVGG
ncbi:tail fiber/spike domain-containing protein [Proteus penneri]|uniref:tail fiber/spike domain-containing protein n=3 Tax=Proteus penneri TaxID=102862 RepID=UPI00288AC2C4|nr:GDSL-type esterase/lipase family protein [Proteus penneri]